MPEELIGLILLSFTILLLPAICVAVTRQAAEGLIGANASAGIRTRYTRASSAAWVAGHTAALPVVKIMWPVAGAGLVTAAVVQLIAGGPTGTGVAFLALIAQTMVLLRSAAVANRAARSATHDDVQ
ncbi:hypothetical protein [Arthrobacter flavus]|uniref:SdpI/YhfL protein family protein n=1 Tax=Arthrobacter flavus TaxID=95172 RepID=A0ABW4QC29_9MICC